MTSRRADINRHPPPTAEERDRAGKAAQALRAFVADRDSAGRCTVAHILMSRPRRGTWIATWQNLPGLLFDKGAQAYSHALLPGWEYSAEEMRTEMIDDLELLARDGMRPKQSTRNNAKQGRLAL